jgi:hypothetical protein
VLAVESQVRNSTNNVTETPQFIELIDVLKNYINSNVTSLPNMTYETGLSNVNALSNMTTILEDAWKLAQQQSGKFSY